MRRFGSVFLAAILGSIITLTAYHFIGDKNPVRVEYVNNTPAAQVGYMINEDGEKVAIDFTTVASTVTKAVVHIKSTSKDGGGPKQHPFFNSPFRDFFDMPEGGPHMMPSQSSGSGVIINPNGYIVTNNHVVANADLVEVTLFDNRTISAEVIGTDPDTDIALIKIEANELPHLAFANSDESRIGEWVLAVGNPFNLNSTVTAGIISAKERNINIIGARSQSAEGETINSAIESFIQTDAAINPGNSGGALVNMQGNLIGINTAIASPTGSYSGYGFAVPSNLASKIVEDLISYGVVQRGMLGVLITNVNSSLVKEKELKVNEGAFVSEVSELGAAKEAGIKSGDVITKLDGHPIHSNTAVTQYIGIRRPGDKVKVTVDRSGKEIDFHVVLKNKEGNVAKLEKEDAFGLAGLRIEVSPLKKDELKQLDLTHGVRVQKIGNGAIRKYTDMREGFIITKINEKDINTPQQLDNAIQQVKEGDVITLAGIYEDFPREFLYSFRK